MHREPGDPTGTGSVESNKSGSFKDLVELAESTPLPPVIEEAPITPLPDEAFSAPEQAQPVEDEASRRALEQAREYLKKRNGVARTCGKDAYEALSDPQKYRS